jgi:butyrate kinase
MGTLSHARGDFVTALDYLRQSLTIRQEIGDRSGFCATLINIGHIHRHNKEPQEAMRCWATVYQTAREIGEAQALTALAALAEQLDLHGGLEGWERVAQKMKLEGASHAP